MSTRAVDARLCAEIEHGYLVATISRERGRFSITGEIHNSRRAYELGTGNPHAAGCIHEDILCALPQLAPIVRMHLADANTGEPMHAASNGWYRLSGADMMHELDAIAKGRKNYYKAPEPWLYLDFGYGQACEQTQASEQIIHDDRDTTRTLNPAFVQFFVDMSASNLNCDADELSIWWDHEDFTTFVDRLRPRWQRMADEANRLIDGMESAPDPSEETDCETFAVELDAGLKISAELTGETGYLDGVGSYYEYDVVVAAGRKRYTAKFGGSVADYNDGVVNAREAAFSTARELLTFEHETARNFIEEVCGESWEDLPADQRQALTRAEKAFDRMADALIANRETLGG